AVASDALRVASFLTSFPADDCGWALSSRLLSIVNAPPDAPALDPPVAKSRLSRPAWLTSKFWMKWMNEIRLLTNDRSLPEAASELPLPNPQSQCACRTPYTLGKPSPVPRMPAWIRRFASADALTTNFALSLSKSVSCNGTPALDVVLLSVRVSFTPAISS